MKKRRGSVKSRNMYKGPVDKYYGGVGQGRIECGSGGMGGAGESNGGKWGQL